MAVIVSHKNHPFDPLKAVIESLGHTNLISAQNKYLVYELANPRRQRDDVSVKPVDTYDILAEVLAHGVINLGDLQQVLLLSQNLLALFDFLFNLRELGSLLVDLEEEKKD